MKANVVRLQPNQEQEKLLRVLGDRASALWNVANYEYRQAFLKNTNPPSYTGQCASLIEHPVFRSLPSDIAQEVLKNPSGDVSTLTLVALLLALSKSV